MLINDEPVAWIPKGMTLAKPKDLTDCIPLYTHPAKTLTDEEIKELEKNYFTYDDWTREWSIKPLDFARAILRKAQEK
jgi:hypothetical protein